MMGNLKAVCAAYGVIESTGKPSLAKQYFQSFSILGWMNNPQYSEEKQKAIAAAINYWKEQASNSQLEPKIRQMYRECQQMLNQKVRGY